MLRDSGGGGFIVVMIQQNIVLDEVEKQIEEAKLYNKEILFTLVEKVEAKDPLLIFEAGMKRFGGSRSFWNDSDDCMSIVGLGEAYCIEMNDSHFQFSDVEKRWRQLILDSAIKMDDYISGTGPILIGGFSFDPLKEKSFLWRNYPNAKFTLPKYMYTLNENQAWLTVNVVCNQESNAKEIVNDYYLMKHELFQTQQFSLDTLSHNKYIENEIEPEKWMETVRTAANEIQHGELEKVVLARETRLTFTSKIHLTRVIGNLRHNQANSYIFAFEMGDDCFVGATPERLVKKENHQILSTCLAGSIGRGSTMDEDTALGEALLNDKKNLIEHGVVVHMIKEAMQEVCETISVPDGPTLYKTRHIQHLYTPVIGHARENTSLLSVVEKLHPTPALGGFPQEKALKKIREIELLDRGWYGAPIGWLDFKGDGEFAVGIRSGLIQNQEISLFAGCGIVEDSDPVSEYYETKMKFKPMLSALEGIKHENE